MTTPAWTAPTTWAAGNVPTAIQFNQQLRDNPLHLAVPASCCVRNSATQSIASGGSIVAGTALAFGAELWDTDAFHSNVTNNSRMTVPAGLAGTYHFETTVTFPIIITANRVIIGVAVNGTLYKGLQSTVPSAGLATALTGSLDLILAVGDYVETWVYQNEGSAITLAVESNNGGVRSSLRKVSN